MDACETLGLFGAGAGAGAGANTHNNYERGRRTMRFVRGSVRLRPCTCSSTNRQSIVSNETGYTHSTLAGTMCCFMNHPPRRRK